MYKTIIFDVDGTLINTEQAVLHSLQKMLHVDYNKSVELDDLTFVLGIPGSRSLPQLGISDIDKANERWNYFMKDYFNTIEVFEGIFDLVNHLRDKNINQGIVTSKTKEELKCDFEPFGLMPYLTHIVCADDTEFHKPHPEPLLKFLEIADAKAEQSIYIGDTVYDYECARDAGVDFALALWGCKNHQNIEAKYKLETPLDLIKFI
ncbi:HAD family hydrolase [Paenibacillus guangzhouensis]|uniref:HAD family hydrolase n=1 Tax=Paenibacillus guangzhouensis TaxID=1473112 RepID=UPI001266B8B7|nr:HAD family hydrolase [Paenibacillus guangzhouensis]